MLHALLTLLLLLEELALAGDVATVALGRYVLAQRLDRLARHDSPTDGGLDRDVEHVTRDLLPEGLTEVAAADFGHAPVADRRERVDGGPVDEDVEADQVGREVAQDVVAEGRVAAGPRLELVVVVEHDLGQGQVVDEDHAVLADVLLADVVPALLLVEGHDQAQELGRRHDRGPHDGLADLVYEVRVGEEARGVDHDHLPVALLDLVFHARRGLDHLNVRLALDPLLDDVHVEHSEEAAAEAEPEGFGLLGLEGEAGVVEAELIEGLAEDREVRVEARVNARIDHGLDFFVARQRLGRDLT